MLQILVVGAEKRLDPFLRERDFCHLVLCLSWYFGR
jgi:hypothetical protein